MKLNTLEQLIECYGAIKSWKSAKECYDDGKKLLAANSNFQKEHVDEFRSKANNVGITCFGNLFEQKESWRQFVQERRGLTRAL